MGFHFLDWILGAYLKPKIFSGGTLGGGGLTSHDPKTVSCFVWKRVNVTRGSLSKGISTYKNKTNKKQLICHGGVNPQVKFHWRKTLEFWAIESPGWQICLTDKGNRKAPNPKKTQTHVPLWMLEISLSQNLVIPSSRATFKFDMSFA